MFGDVDHDSSLAREEIFGPVLSVLRFHDEDEVVAKANDSDFGLSAYLHTARRRRAPSGSRRRLEVGTVIVNGFPAMSPGAPFGGVKQSGFGREGGRAGIEEFVRRKNVVFSCRRRAAGRRGRGHPVAPVASSSRMVVLPATIVAT